MKSCSNRVHRVVGAVLLMVALAACASAEKAPQQTGPATLEGQPPSGFVEMEEVQVAYMGNAGGGEGTLTFRGQRYPFKIAGLGVGGFGVSLVDAEGEVYRLTDVQQFSGAYVRGAIRRRGRLRERRGHLAGEPEPRRHAPEGEARGADAQRRRRRDRHPPEPMIDAFKAWAEQFAKRLDELGACPA